MHLVWPAMLLMGAKEVDHLVLADARGHGCEVPEPRVERDQAERVLEKHGRDANRADRPRDGRGDRHAVDAAPGRLRHVGDRHDAGGARLREIAHDQRAEVRDGRLRPVDGRQAIARLPVAQPDEVESAAVKHAAVIADRELAHPVQDAQLNLGEIREVHQRIVGVLAASHGMATRSTTSLMTASVVRPWLAACGPSQMRCLRMWGARSWMSSGYTSVRRRTSSAQTFASRPQQMMARGEAPRSTLCSTSAEGDRTSQSVSGLYGRVAATSRWMYVPTRSCRNTCSLIAERSWMMRSFVISGLSRTRLKSECARLASSSGGGESVLTMSVK